MIELTARSMEEGTEGPDRLFQRFTEVLRHKIKDYAFCLERDQQYFDSIELHE